MTGSRPSTITGIEDRWAAIQFDQAVNLLGITISNAAQELHKVGSKDDVKYEPVYTMDQLLNDDFKLPRPRTPEERERDAIASLRALAKVKGGGVKVFRAKGNKDGTG